MRFLSSIFATLMIVFVIGFAIYGAVAWFGTGYVVGKYCSKIEADNTLICTFKL